MINDKKRLLFKTHNGPAFGFYLIVNLLACVSGYVVYLLTRFDGDFEPNPPLFSRPVSMG